MLSLRVDMMFGLETIEETNTQEVINQLIQINRVNNFLTLVSKILVNMIFLLRYKKLLMNQEEKIFPMWAIHKELHKCSMVYQNMKISFIKKELIFL